MRVVKKGLGDALALVVTAADTDRVLNRDSSPAGDAAPDRRTPH